MDHEPDLVRAQRKFERRRSPSVVVGVLATFVLIALIKPWSFGQDGSDASRPTTAPIPSGAAIAATPSADAVPSPTATPAIVDPNAMACLTDDAEQIVLFERWAGTEVRSWIAAKDSIVPGPLDARLVPIPIFSSHVIGLGVCAPRSPTGAQDPAARLLDIRAIVETDAGHPGDRPRRTRPHHARTGRPRACPPVRCAGVGAAGRVAGSVFPRPSLAGSERAEAGGQEPGAERDPIADRRPGELAYGRLRDRLPVQLGRPESRTLVAHRSHPGRGRHRLMAAPREGRRGWTWD